ncbi:MAG: hypothetical protein SNJ50_15050 [Cyanobacteriota bacterium]
MQVPVSTEFALPDPQTSSASPILSVLTFPKNIKAHLGKKVWYCLNAESQQDLQTVQRLAADSGEQFDSSALGRSLLSVVLQEVVEPFIAALGEYWLEQTGDTQLGDLSLDPEEFKTPSALITVAMLLAPTWQAIRESALKMPLEPAAADLYISAGNPDDEAAEDARYQVAEFLQSWEHPLAGWIQDDPTAAASLLAQMGQLAHGAFEKGRSLFPWQLNLLQQKILGTPSELGLLQCIYGSL